MVQLYMAPPLRMLALYACTTYVSLRLVDLSTISSDPITALKLSTPD